MPFCRGFKRPSAAASRDAVDTPRVPAPPAIAALRDSDTCPPPVPTPHSPDDWLAQYVEPGQTMAEFLSQCPWLSRRKRKYYRGTFRGQGGNCAEKYPNGKICLLPLGDFGAVDGPSMRALQEYTEAFYRGMRVCVLPPIDVVVPAKSGQPVLWRDTASDDGSGTAELPHRRHGKRIQLQIDGVLNQLRSSVHVDDALMVVAVTMHELFDAPTDLFVAGMASGLHSVAVFSFTRYHPQMVFSPEFWWKIDMPAAPAKPQQKAVRSSRRKRPAAAAAAAGAAKSSQQHDEGAAGSRLLLERCCKLLVHEIGHLLGIDHCIHYSCCMNGSGHLEEDFKQPSFLCPVCLHKAHALAGFDIADRYAGMIEFFSAWELREDEAAAKQLLAAVAGAAGGAGVAARRVRGRPAATGAPVTVDLTTDDHTAAAAAAGSDDEVICLHSPVASTRSGRREPEAGGELDEDEGDETLPLAERLAKRMRTEKGGARG